MLNECCMCSLLAVSVLYKLLKIPPIQLPDVGTLPNVQNQNLANPYTEK